MIALKATLRIAVLLLAAFYAISHQQSISSAETKTHGAGSLRSLSTALDADPCNCQSEKQLALSNAARDNLNCYYSVNVQIDSCIDNADGQRELDYDDCWEYYYPEFEYIEECWYSADQTSERVNKFETTGRSNLV